MNVTALPTCQLVMNISMDSFLAFQCLEDQLSQLVGQFRIVGNALFGSIASLSQFGIVVAVPRTALLDEVQFLDCFESVLNSYLHMDNVDVYVTGSNAKFLSKDVITEFA